MKKQRKRQKKREKKIEKMKAKEAKKAAVTPQTSVEEANARRMVPMTKEEWEKQQVHHKRLLK